MAWAICRFDPVHDRPLAKCLNLRLMLTRICFAANPGCWPGRALPTSGCPQPGRPHSGCALGPFVPHAAHAPREVSRTASRRLRAVFAYAPTAARWRGLPSAACSARPTPPSGLMRGQRSAWSACVTPGQRRTPYAWPSGLLPSRARPRPSSPSASAGGKGSLQRPSGWRLEPEGVSLAHIRTCEGPLQLSLYLNLKNLLET